MLTVGIKYTQVQSEMQDLNVWLDNIDRMLREGNIQDIKVCVAHSWQKLRSGLE